MGMGYSANFALVISDTDIEKIVPEDFKKLIQTLKKNNTNLDSIARFLFYNYSDDDKDEFTLKQQENISALESLLNNFKTITGISLNLKYHDSTNWGDIYDDIDGYYFDLDFYDIFQYTHNAQKLSNNKISASMQFFVTCG